MAKNVCCLCKSNIGGFLGVKGGRISESYINDIPAYFDIFPSSPYKQFSEGDSYICVLCAEKIANLFRCNLDRSFFPPKICPNKCTDNQVEKAKESVTKLLSFKPKGVDFTIEREDQDFIEYALEIPTKITHYLESKRSEIKNVLQSVIPEKKKEFFNVLEYIKSENIFAESNSYTFGIVDDMLVYAPFSKATVNREVYTTEQSYEYNLSFYATPPDPTFSNQLELEYHEKKLRELENLKPEFFKIPIKKIGHFKIVGGIGYSSNVHGGGGSGGGVNTSGAIVGGLLFGGAGAIIGSQMGTEIHIDEIKTEVTKHDDRSVEFFYEDETGKTVSVIFESSAYDCLMALIPEKAFDSVVTNTLPKEEPVAVASSNSSLSQLKELKELLDMGIITPEEFDAKKKQILGL